MVSTAIPRTHVQWQRVTTEEVLREKGQSEEMEGCKHILYDQLGFPWGMVYSLLLQCFSAQHLGRTLN